MITINQLDASDELEKEKIIGKYQLSDRARTGFNDSTRNIRQVESSQKTGVANLRGIFKKRLEK